MHTFFTVALYLTQPHIQHVNRIYFTYTVLTTFITLLSNFVSPLCKLQTIPVLFHPHSRHQYILMRKPIQFPTRKGHCSKCYYPAVNETFLQCTLYYGYVSGKVTRQQYAVSITQPASGFVYRSLAHRFLCHKLVISSGHSVILEHASASFLQIYTNGVVTTRLPT